MKIVVYKYLLSILIITLWACNSGNEPTTYTSYIGSWKCEETSSVVGYMNPYRVKIDRNTSDTMQYFIQNFFDAGDNQMIVVTIKDTTVSLLQQPTSGHVLQAFSGSCIPYTKLNLSYTIYDGEQNVYFEAVYSR